MDCELSLVPISLSFPTRRPLKSVRRSGRSHDKGCENHSEQARVGAVFTSPPRTPFFCPLESRIGSPQVPSFHSGTGTQMSTHGRASRDCKALHAMPDRPARPLGSPLGTRGEAPSKGTLCPEAGSPTASRRRSLAPRLNRAQSPLLLIKGFPGKQLWVTHKKP